MTPTNIKHAVFETSRHADGSAKVQIVGAFGTFGIVVPAAGHSEPMTEHQKIEALRNALSAMGEASELLKGISAGSTRTAKRRTSPRCLRRPPPSWRDTRPGAAFGRSRPARAGAGRDRVEGPDRVKMPSTTERGRR